MDLNTHSSRRSERFAALAAAINDLDREDLDRLTDTAVADDLLALRPLVERLEGQWRKRLAVADARGAAGADQDRQFGSTAAWLRARLRMSRHAAAPRSGPPGPCSAGPCQKPVPPCVLGSSRSPTPRYWPPGPWTWLIMSPPTPKRRCWTQPGGWTRPGCAGRSPTCATRSTLRGPTVRPNDAMNGAGSGSPRPWTIWSPSAANSTPKPARPCSPPWTP